MPTTYASIEALSNRAVIGPACLGSLASSSSTWLTLAAGTSLTCALLLQ